MINSFIPDNDGNFIDCKNISNANIYKVICCKLNWCWVPIIILIYLIIMVGNSYSIVSIKWLMDIKYIKLFKILLSLGIFGLIFSLGELFISSYIPCQNKDFFISDINICAIKYKNQSFYDNFRALSNIKVITEFYIDIFIIIPLFLISSFLDKFFELLIIVNLDPFYLIPIDCVFYFIIEIVDYFITFQKRQKFRNLKFVFLTLSNGFAIFLFSIYLEIVELHFWKLDRFLRKNIILREIEEKNFILLEDINDDIDYPNENS